MKLVGDRLAKAIKVITTLDQSLDSVEKICLRVWAIEMGVEDISDSKKLKEVFCTFTFYDFVVKYFKEEVTEVSVIFEELKRQGWTRKE